MLVLKDDEGFKRCFYFFGGGGVGLQVISDTKDVS